MCGIAGILGHEDDGTVRQMMDRIAHRGPDGDGTWSDPGVSLGHRRLAILDVEHGQQPMTDTTGRYTIIYNGECYNHLALRPALQAAGVRFRTTTDTETVLEGYRIWGPQVLERMEGMFALAIWDSVEKVLFIARDPWGIKPFFHAFTHDGAWVFASEQKALFAHPGLTAAADVERIKERTVLEFLTGQATLFQGVHQLPPGTWAKIAPGDDALLWHLYYQVPAEDYATPEQAIKAIRERFLASVEEQLLSDVPLGTVLSGGLDSAAVVAAHRHLHPDSELHTFTVAQDESVPDFQAARSLAEELGTVHHEAFFDADTIWRGLAKWTWHNENINHTEFFFEPLFKMMRQDVKVGLCGQGSDELWGGYDRYRDPLALGNARLGSLHTSRPAHRHELGAAIAMTHTSPSSLAEWDQQGQLANFQLRLVDRNAMAHGLEVRVPFLSRSLHAASRAVPWAWKLRGGPEGTEKWVLREALRGIGLPDALRTRRKVPAGRATAPGAIERFDAMAREVVDPSFQQRHALSSACPDPASFLLLRVWEELFITHQGAPDGMARIDLHTVAQEAV